MGRKGKEVSVDMREGIIELKYLGCCGEKDIITDSSLDAIRELVIVLRTNVQVIGHGWVFRAGAAIHQGVVQEILTAIRKGSTTTVRSMLEAGWRLESAQALYLFLTSLPRPLVPQSIQALVLDDAGNVPVDVVATDVLGLMKQELPNKHLKLISLLLNLLDTVIKFSPADELRGNTLPISMLPLFFNIQTQHMQEWRRIVTIFVELIRQAGQHLQAPDLTDNVHLTESSLLSEMYPVVQPVDLGENMVVRTYLVPVGMTGLRRRQLQYFKYYIIL
ncbi:hypothetical protein NQ318_008247 [Aromia moschata]|uniref:Rho-GAP domain-containing protein n=1 Tax=Aromia moschata TaxID=1265417 RepID=A0AAV8Y8K5_9CUCU|nr:hypothetical protein NQ318_008247 [Aromia moschata]